MSKYAGCSGSSPRLVSTFASEQDAKEKNAAISTAGTLGVEINKDYRCFHLNFRAAGPTVWETVALGTGNPGLR